MSARRRWPLALRMLLAATLGAAAAVVAVVVINHTPDLPPGPAPRTDAATVARGAYLARLGNCAACHTPHGSTPYAGGRGIATPFGTVYAGNLTPDDGTGLGRWSADDFWRALHHGRSRDGRLLSPAFPYTSFTHVSRDDSNALYAYLRSLAPTPATSTPSTLRFPFNTQAALAVWRAVYFRPADTDSPSPADRTAQWQRGAYLVRGLGHCAACHAPRNALGATLQGDALPGGTLPLQPWHAPSLAPDGQQPIARQQQDIVDLLRTGWTAHGTASGPMAEVVVGSTQYWTDQDLWATAVYLSSLPARPPAPKAQPKAGDEIATQVQRGRALYDKHCAGCHGVQGEGAGRAYPALAGNHTVNQTPADNLLQVIRHGGFAPSTTANRRPFGMPPAALDPQEAADVATYVRQAWGNQAPAVSILESLRAP
ncbi:MAG: alcohol dehydrogenase [Burkholderiales bacterium PBB5]|nr:MAG: alcohol dehydrogenase [Burkholderiales bacterium PBB5]